MGREIIFATHNLKKVEEVRSLLGSYWSVLSLEDLNYFDEIPEDGATFQKNAAIKANFVSKKFNINCFADDSGLNVDVLNGEPGIYSGRYAGEPRCDVRNIQLLIKNMNGLHNRSAAFVTCICLHLNGNEYFFEGKVTGEILLQPAGKNGFGYDPVFKPNGYTQSFAEMGKHQKNEISHRAIAVNKLVDFLNNYAGI